MDGPAFLAEPLMRSAGAALSRAVNGVPPARWWDRARLPPHSRLGGRLAAIDRMLRPWLQRLLRLDVPRGAGAAASALIILGSIAYGAERGGHLPIIVVYLHDMRDMAANAAGFRITGIALSGEKHLTREEILTLAGITGRTSLLFVDVADARRKLQTNPWIADATVQKLYPDRLQITVSEREAFALWQKDGRVGVIAADGTVLEPYVARRFTALPLFVGSGAERRAKELLTLLDRYPSIRSKVRASVLVAERRWNLRLANGVDVRLPEAGIDRALDRLIALDRDRKLLSRDITAVDLRLPDRVTVRLSEAAAQAREDVLKTKKIKSRGGNA